MINHDLPRNYDCELEGDLLTKFIQMYEAGNSWPELRAATSLSKYRLENIVLYYDLGAKTSSYKRKVEGIAVNGLRDAKGRLYVNNVSIDDIADDKRHLYVGDKK